MSKGKKLDEKSTTCALCGVKLTGIEALAHKLVAHPAQELGRRKRVRKAQAVLVRVHNQLEQMGFNEAQAHRVTEMIAAELRKAGLV